MRFKQLIAGVLIGLVSCGTFAAPEWKFVDTIDSGFAIYVDTNSIGRVSEYSSQATHKAWIKQIVYKDLEQDGLAIGDYHMILYWVHCNNSTLGAKSVTTYQKQKNGLVRNNTESTSYPKMEDVIPNSIGEGIVDTVCS